MSWRRFCNVPLSPVKVVTDASIQDQRVSSSSEESISHNNSATLESELGSSPNIQRSSPLNQGSNNSQEIIEPHSPTSPSDDSFVDPNFSPSEQGSDTSVEENSEIEFEEDILSPKIKVISNILLMPNNSNKLEENNKESCNIKNDKENSDNILDKDDDKTKDFCYYCETLVLNFARHLKRNHSLEFEVQKAFSFPTGSKSRKEIITGIRKKGNFINNSEKGKPIKKPVIHTKIVPCPNCYGFYSAKSLWRHRRRCTTNPDSKHLSESQNFILRNININNDLRKNVFPRMRADEISLVAKRDTLITQFGTQYIKIHREKHFVNVASRKMRELARLLIELRKIDTSINQLIDALKPEKFEMLVHATKMVAQFDTDGEYFKSPTLALNLATSIKQCCDLALLQVYQKKIAHTIPQAEMESDLKTLIHLIQSKWKYQISSQAANDLNMKKWNKISLLPLATDLKLLKDHLISKANGAELRLKNNSDAEAYVQLLETVYCRLIILNRRRPGELQRFLLRTYLSTAASENDNNYEEFYDVITPTEKILIKQYKRIVIRGKRGRGVPVLFSPDVQNHLNVLLQHRDQYLQKGNLYLFGNPSTTEPICGYKVLKKYAISSGAKHPEALTCTRLRKHMATLAQIFNMTENDLEQLATFMGHTIGIHRQNYRLPDDVYQTAKISKLLMLMESGDFTQFKGKTLDEIDLKIEDEPIIKENDNNIEVDIEDELIEEYDIDTDLNNQPSTSKEAKELVLPLNKLGVGGEKAKIGKKRILVPWTQVQKEKVLTFFSQHIKSGKPPKRHECEALKEKYPQIFENKDWLKIKVYIQNKYKSKLK